MPWISSLLDGLRLLGGGVCHQLPERSLTVAAGIPLPLCARCTGTFLGALLGLSLVIARRRLRASLMPHWPGLALFALYFLAWGGDGFNSYLTLFPGMPHLYEPHNTLRLVTGALQGIALSLTLWPVIAFAVWRHPKKQRVVSLKEIAVISVLGLGLVGMLSLHVPLILLAGALFSLLGMLSMFTLLNALLLLVLRRREGTIKTVRQLLATLSIAFAMGSAELLVLGLLRRYVLRI